MGAFITAFGRKFGLVACFAVAAMTFPGVAAAQEMAKMNGADTAWIIVATALVLFMTMPGLALFYGGLVRSRNVLSVLMHCAVICCVSSIL